MPTRVAGRTTAVEKRGKEGGSHCMTTESIPGPDLAEHLRILQRQRISARSGRRSAGTTPTNVAVYRIVRRRRYPAWRSQADDVPKNHTVHRGGVAVRYTRVLPGRRHSACALRPSSNPSSRHKDFPEFLVDTADGTTLLPYDMGRMGGSIQKIPGPYKTMDGIGGGAKAKTTTAVLRFRDSDAWVVSASSELMSMSRS